MKGLQPCSPYPSLAKVAMKTTGADEANCLGGAHAEGAEPQADEVSAQRLGERDQHPENRFPDLRCFDAASPSTRRTRVRAR